jgi:hypothetical protein
MPAARHLNLAAIEACLRDVQKNFDFVSQRLVEPHDPLNDYVLSNMLMGYALIDSYVTQGIDLFSLNNLDLIFGSTQLCTRLSTPSSNHGESATNCCSDWCSVGT